MATTALAAAHIVKCKEHCACCQARPREHSMCREHVQDKAQLQHAIIQTTNLSDWFVALGSPGSWRLYHLVLVPRSAQAALYLCCSLIKSNVQHASLLLLPSLATGTEEACAVCIGTVGRLLLTLLNGGQWHRPYADVSSIKDIAVHLFDTGSAVCV